MCSVVIVLLVSPKSTLVGGGEVIFRCTFEVDFCGMSIHGVWYRGRETDTQDTGPKFGGAKHSRMSCLHMYSLS